MTSPENPEAAAARRAAPDAIPVLLSSASEEVIHALLENPALDETHVCLLLERKDLPSSVLEEISKRKAWHASHRIRRALAAHPHTPRLIAMRLLRELYLLDLVQISLAPACSAELRRLADARILTQLPQLPLGQKLMLARRGSARVAGGLIAQESAQVARIALDNAFLTESQLLKALARENLCAAVVAAAASHAKWSQLITVRAALLRHPNLRPDRAASFLPTLPLGELKEIVNTSRLPETVRERVSEELERRKVSELPEESEELD